MELKKIHHLSRWTQTVPSEWTASVLKERKLIQYLLKTLKRLLAFLIDHIKTRKRLFASFYSETNRKKRKEKEQGNGQWET